MILYFFIPSTDKAREDIGDSFTKNESQIENEVLENPSKGEVNNTIRAKKVSSSNYKTFFIKDLRLY